MKIEIIRGTVNHDNKEYKTGQIADIPDENAERLIKLGVAKKSGDAPVANPQTPPPERPDPDKGSGGKK
jgi:hypothetical protein